MNQRFRKFIKKKKPFCRILFMIIGRNFTQIMENEPLEYLLRALHDKSNAL